MKPYKFQRVIPRDLFNEAKLLKCLGRLSLLILDGLPWPLVMTHDDDADPGFKIEQHPDSGELYCENIELTLNGECIPLASLYNAKDRAYPLMFDADDGCQSLVFDDDGSLSEEFVAFATQKSSEVCDEV